MSIQKPTCSLRLRLVALAIAGCCRLAGAAEAQGVPGPGEYRIDSEAVTTMGSGAASAEITLQSDGATGTVVTTSRTPGGPPESRTFKGDKPLTWCVRPGPAPESLRNSPFACQTSNVRSTATDSSLSAACRSMTLDNTFRRIDARTWEHMMTLELRSAGGDPMHAARAALAAALPHMSAAERAEAEKEMAEMPSQAEMDRNRAEIEREMEASIRSGPPEEAAATRQALEAMRRSQAGGTVQQTTRVKERWTLISASCSR